MLHMRGTQAPRIQLNRLFRISGKFKVTPNQGRQAVNLPGAEKFGVPPPK